MNAPPLRCAPPDPPIRLSAFHRRCLDRRVGECSAALAQAVSAFDQAREWAPEDVRLPVAFELLRAARVLTVMARSLSSSEINAGDDPLAARKADRIGHQDSDGAIRSACEGDPNPARCLCP
jgi:hypothetical protein